MCQLKTLGKLIDNDKDTIFSIVWGPINTNLLNTIYSSKWVQPKFHSSPSLADHKIYLLPL